MSTQPEALRLAEQLEAIGLHGPVAAELRRLHAENEELWKEREEPHKTIEMYVSECNRLERERDALKAQRDALLEACKAYDKWADKTHCYDRELRPIRAQIRAAIKAVEGEQA